MGGVGDIVVYPVYLTKLYTVLDVNVRSLCGGDVHFRRKSPIFPTPRVYIAPDEGAPLGIGVRGPECFYDGLPDGQKSFKIGLVV